MNNIETDYKDQNGENPTKYCCKMREKYLIGIIMENVEVPQPIDAIDFIDFEIPHPEGKLVIRIKYCPFCGKPIIGPMRIA